MLVINPISWKGHNSTYVGLHQPRYRRNLEGEGGNHPERAPESALSGFQNYLPFEEGTPKTSDTSGSEAQRLERFSISFGPEAVLLI